MSFFRPEARAALWRVREVLAGAVVATVGVWLILGQGLTVWLGYAAAVLAVGLILVGIQRSRFRVGGGGPGVVAIDEGQIGYFGPLSGGIVAVADIRRLTFDPTGRPAHWLIESGAQPLLQIPINAEGADTLFDAFAALPGLRTERMLSELRGDAKHPVVIWEKTGDRPDHARLH